MRTITRFMQSAFGLLPLLALALVIAGCATTGDSAAPVPELSGTRWFVTAIDGRPPLRDMPLTADFTVEGRITGDSGCNSFSGPYVQTGSTVQIGELLSTRRACVDSNLQRQEGRLLDILQGASMAHLVRGRLQLRAGDGTLVLAPASVSDTSFVYPRRANFDCEGVNLNVLFEGGRASLTWPENRDVLEQQQAATGMRYESSRNSLSGKQDLLWTLDGGTPRTCRELR
ncbi:MAG TPA: META domain-containing protein [Steroidobacteraceae bacterium]|nr:META domain-containing protein [Steroidobacteraceae bacterium]